MTVDTNTATLAFMMLVQFGAVIWLFASLKNKTDNNSSRIDAIEAKDQDTDRHYIEIIKELTELKTIINERFK
jgi:hypothetical protein